MVDLKKIQKLQKEFILERKWERFEPSLVFSHLIEELGEIASHFLYQAGYKVEGLGHKATQGKEKLAEEFAQSFNLFLQLAISADIDLETAWYKEYEKNKTRFSSEEWKKLADEKLKSVE